MGLKYGIIGGALGYVAHLAFGLPLAVLGASLAGCSGKLGDVAINCLALGGMIGLYAPIVLGIIIGLSMEE